jgi:hypothetical protein
MCNGILRYQPETLRKKKKTSICIAGLLAEIPTQDLQNTKLEFYSLNHDVRLQANGVEIFM